MSPEENPILGDPVRRVSRLVTLRPVFSLSPWLGLMTQFVIYGFLISSAACVVFVVVVFFLVALLLVGGPRDLCAAVAVALDAAAAPIMWSFWCFMGAAIVLDIANYLVVGRKS